MLISIELLLLAYVLWKLSNICRHPLSQILSGIAATVIAIATSSAVFYLGDLLLEFLPIPLLYAVSTTIILGLLTFFVTKFYAMRWLKGKPSEVSEKPWHKNTARLSRFVFFGSFCLAIWLVINILVNILVQLPQWSSTIENDSLYSHYFVIPESIVDESLPSEKPPLEEKIPDSTKLKELQALFFSNVNKGLKQSRDYLNEVSGTKMVLENIKALKDLAEMPLEKKNWIFKNNENLNQLLNNKKLLAVIANDKLMKSINRASQGDLDAIAGLMVNPVMEDLLKDKKIYQNVKKLDLPALRDQVNNHFSKDK